MSFIPFFLFAFISLIITLGITVGSVLSNTLIAYGFSRIDWPGREQVFYLCLATIFLPYPVILVALFDIFGEAAGVRDPGPGFVGQHVPAADRAGVLRQPVLYLPDPPVHADDPARAVRRRARGWRERVADVLEGHPAAHEPAVTVVAIFAAVGAWNDSLPLLYLHDQSKYPLAVGLALHRGARRSHNLLMAATTLVVLPVVVIFLVAQRFFVEGSRLAG